MLSKLIILFLTVFVSFSSVLATEVRRDTVTVNPKTIRPCKNPSLTVRKAFDKPVEAKIVKHRLEGWLYINCPTIHQGMDLNACYLPVEACEEGLKILITGNLLTFPGMDRAQLRALPFQLTSLKVIRK
jgi:hypothetical protein